MVVFRPDGRERTLACEGADCALSQSPRPHRLWERVRVRVHLSARFAAKRALQKFSVSGSSDAPARGARSEIAARRDGTLTLPSPAYFAGEGIKENWRRRNGCRARAPRGAGLLGAIAMMATAVAGCAAGAAPAPVVRPLLVRVPVLHETPCPAPRLADPALPIAGLTAGSPPADTMRAYAAAVAILKGAVRERDAVLAGCARAARTTPAPPAMRVQAEKTQ